MKFLITDNRIIIIGECHQTKLGKYTNSRDLKLREQHQGLLEKY